MIQNRIKTYTGIYFHFPNLKEGTNLDAERKFDILDIAHGLSNMCRYNGQCSRFFSVAEHSVYVSWIADNPLEALLHDLSEAYMSDITTGVKPLLGGYYELEDFIMKEGFESFGLEYPLSENTKHCDKALLYFAERQVLMREGTLDINDPSVATIPSEVASKASRIKIQCLPPIEAEKLFLDRFAELTNPQPFFFPIVSSEIMKNLTSEFVETE